MRIACLDMMYVGAFVETGEMTSGWGDGLFDPNGHQPDQIQIQLPFHRGSKTVCLVQCETLFLLLFGIIHHFLHFTNTSSVLNRWVHVLSSMGVWNPVSYASSPACAIMIPLSMQNLSSVA